MAGWKVTATTVNGVADIHKSSGVFTYGTTLCPGVPGCSSSYNTYSVTAILEPDNIDFDDYTSLIEGNYVEQKISAKGCNCEGLVMWFSGASNNEYIVLDDNTIFSGKNVDECDQVIIGTPITGSQSFESTTYVETGYPAVGRNTGLTNGHKIKYIPTSDTIPDDFYRNHTGLVELYFPHLYNGTSVGYNTKTIGQRAFQGCTDLSAITLSSVETIRDYAFNDCTKLSKIDWGHGSNGSTCPSLVSSVKSVGNYAFMNCSSLVDVSIPISVTFLGSSAFNGCTNLKRCLIHAHITEIKNYTFRGCNHLSSVTITTTGITTIGNGAFNNCSDLTSITIPNSVTSIGELAFKDCTAISSIEIPSGVTSIGLQAFSNCSSLTSIKVNAAAPPTLGSMVFYNTNDCPIYVPSGSVEVYKTTSGWSNYANRIQAIP